MDSSGQCFARLRVYLAVRGTLLLRDVPTNRGCGLFGCFVGFHRRWSLEDVYAKGFLLHVRLLAGFRGQRLSPWGLLLPSGRAVGLKYGLSPISTKVWQGFDMFSQKGVRLAQSVWPPCPGTLRMAFPHALAFPTCLPWWSGGKAVQLALGWRSHSGLADVGWNKVQVLAQEGHRCCVSVPEVAVLQQWTEKSHNPQLEELYEWKVLLNAAGECYCLWAGWGELHPFAVVFWSVSCNPREVWLCNSVWPSPVLLLSVTL